MTRVRHLYNDLDKHTATADVGPHVTVVYNAILQGAKDDRPDDPILSALDPLDSPTDAQTLRVLVGQITAALTW